MFIWKEPSPSMFTTFAFGFAIFAPIAAGRPKPIVPAPSELMNWRGLENMKFWGVHIWCCPTPVVTRTPPPEILYSSAIASWEVIFLRSRFANGYGWSFFSSTMRAIHLEKSGFFASLLAADINFDRVFPASAQTLKSALTFLLCSEGSMSRCMIFRVGARTSTPPP